MDSLPGELHYTIASHLTRSIDSAHYRLTSKYFAHIGASTHFTNFPFGHGTSSDAITRMVNLASSPHVKHVKGIDYFQEPPPKTSEERADQARLLTRVVRGLVDAGAPIDLIQAQGLSFSFFSDKLSASGGAQFNFATSCERLRDLTLCFRADPCVPRMRQQFAKRATEDNFRTYLGKLNYLQVLSVSFEEQEFRRDRHCLRDVVPLKRKWKGLKSIYLDWMYVDGNDIVELLRNHAETLECVHFSCLALQLEGGSANAKKKQWRKVFEQIGKMKLRDGSVSERWSAGGEEEEVEWVVRGNDGRETVIKTDLKKYLIEGGEG
jgi:hypothetical protein